MGCGLLAGKDENLDGPIDNTFGKRRGKRGKYYQEKGSFKVDISDNTFGQKREGIIKKRKFKRLIFLLGRAITISL